MRSTPAVPSETICCSEAGTLSRPTSTVAANQLPSRCSSGRDDEDPSSETRSSRTSLVGSDRRRADDSGVHDRLPNGEVLSLIEQEPSSELERERGQRHGEHEGEQRRKRLRRGCAGGAAFPMSRSRGELVAQTANGLDQTWVARVALDLRAEAADVGVDEPPVACVVIPPYLGKERIARQQAIRVLREIAEQVELGSREVDVLAVA